MLRAPLVFSTVVLAATDTLKCLQDSCGTTYKACNILPACRAQVIDCMETCSDFYRSKFIIGTCQTNCVEFAAKEWKVGPSLLALASLDTCGGFNSCFSYGAEIREVRTSQEPCCKKPCEAPLEKYFSTDAPHGFCGEACMDPKKFWIYHKFESNLTKATTEHPCSQQLTPSNSQNYTRYMSTVTHGIPHVLAVTLDLYAPTDMPDISCCETKKGVVLDGCDPDQKQISIFGTGPYCCPQTANEDSPCASDSSASVMV